ncbi:MAG: polysaccharide pyruvyl transferase family protein, partial [Clostridia bacterium]|nr:polysaccharide pyruvyl transferase family protein [Clostridia bacterium]
NNMCLMVKKMFGDKYQVVALYNYCKNADVNLYDLTPYEWAYVFRYFKLTFTTFFHGTLLSLRDGVPVICIDLNTEFGKKHTPKTLDVLKRLGFEDWYFTTDYKTTNLNEIKEKADELIAGDYKDAIITAMDKEAESFEAFNSALKELLGKDKEK